MRPRRRKPRKINIPCTECGSIQRRSEKAIPESKVIFCKRCKRGKGENHPRFKTGSYVDRAGYRMILIDDVYKREHRVIWEQVNHATLLKGAQIHHINKDKLDNSPDNLLLLTATEHAQLHRAIDNKVWILVTAILLRAGHRQLYYASNINSFLSNHVNY